ncbi:MAG: BTAD domain-containing putative transcriptional regulator [Eubacteriaceae bacterium]
MTNSIKINLFGGMSVEVDNNLLLNSNSKLYQHWKLLAYLVLHKDTSLAAKQIIYAMYGEYEDSVNAQNTLKNTVYCLRKELGDNSFVLFNNGSYKWNEENSILLDIDKFNNLIQSLSQSDDIDYKKSLYKNIIDLYKGDILPQLHIDKWAGDLSQYYRQIFTKAVLEYLEILFDNKQYNEILAVANHATNIDTYNEYFYLYMFKALYFMNMNTLIVSTYMQINKIINNDFSSEAANEIQKIYEDANKKLNKIELDIAVIKDTLKETTFDNSPIKGPFFCGFEVFKQMYQFNVRAAAREERAIILMLLTVTDKSDKVPDNKILLDAMLELREVLTNTIRKNDIFTQYSKAQYLLMLSTDAADKAQIAFSRIKNNFIDYLNINQLNLISKLSMQDFDEAKKMTEMQ